MPIRSAHNMLEANGIAAGAGSRSAYTYLFPDLAGDDRVGCFAGTTPRQTWDRLKAFEVATRVPLSDLAVNRMRLPPSYTYFGQFVNHDISAPTGDVVAVGGTAPMGVVGAVDPPGLDRSTRAGVAVILRIIFTGIVTTLMNVPYLKAAGATEVVSDSRGRLRPAAERKASLFCSVEVEPCVRVSVLRLNTTA